MIYFDIQVQKTVTEQEQNPLNPLVPYHSTILVYLFKKKNYSKY